MKNLTIKPKHFDLICAMSENQRGALIKALIDVSKGESLENQKKSILAPLKAILQVEDKKPKAQSKLIEIPNELEKESQGFIKWLPSVMGYSSYLRDLSSNAKKQRQYMDTYLKLRLTYSKDEVKKAILYAVNDSFWRSNFLSPNKLLDIQKSSGVTYMDYFLSQSQLKQHEQKKEREAAGFRDSI